MVKTFSDFVLTEAKTSFSLSDFPHILKSVTTAERGNPDLMAKRLTQLLELLNKALAATEIPNPTFNDIKSYLSSFVESATDVTGGAPHEVIDAIRAERGFDDWDYRVSAAPHVPGKLKKVEAAAPKETHPTGKIFFAWYLPTLRELAPLVQAVESLKPKVFKRQPKPVEDRAIQFHNAHLRMAKIKSGPAVIKVLTDLTNQLKGDYAASVTKYYIDWAERADQESDEKYWKDRRDFRVKSSPIYAVKEIWAETGSFDSEARAYQRDRKRPRLTPSYKAVLKTLGDAAAAQMQQDFLIKNVTKLVTIIDLKKSPLKGDPRILSARVGGRGSFEGDIRFEFEDGSSFKVTNKVVWKQNQYGTVFNQYPTTFHDVIMPDGKPMGMPSEERMNQVFVTA